MDQHLIDHHKLWFSEQRHSSPTSSSSSSHAANGGNVDRVLFKDLVEMVPLIETLMLQDRRTNTSFTRRASLVYTKTPSKKVGEAKGRRTAQTISTKKLRELGDSELKKNINRVNQDGVADEFSLFSPNALGAKDREELDMLQEQMEDLQKKLLEKDAILKSTENIIMEKDLAQATINELKCQLEEKDALIRSSNLQFSNAKIQLADKQAALEKLAWEVKTSNQKAEKLQVELDALNDEIAMFMRLFEKSLRNGSIPHNEEDETSFSDPLNDLYLRDYFDKESHMEVFDGAEMQDNIEEKRSAYLTALAAAKDNPSEETLAIATKFGAQLQALVLKPVLV